MERLTPSAAQAGPWPAVRTPTTASAPPRPAIASVLASGLLLVLLALVVRPLAGLGDELRFPAPEFTQGYQFRETTVPEATTELRQWVDVAVLLGALGLAAWLAIWKRSRQGLFALMLFSLAYFGFYKQGCVCPIGAIQNMALALFHPGYAVPLTVIVLFLAPLVFALFLGRVFCSSVCALGAIQDLIALRPVSVPRKLSIGLSMIPYAYLGLAVLFAATDTGFVICRYDPFIGFFRLGGQLPYLVLGAVFLAVGIFVARPYCRFFCPYGVLLGWMSRFARWHLAITPTECVNCRLCETACPFDYIDKPNTGLARENRTTGVKRLGRLLVLGPLLVVLGGWVGHRLSVPMSRYNRTVRLAEELAAEHLDPARAAILETTTFRTQGKTEAELVAAARRVRSQLDVGGWLFGGFLGAIFSAKLIRVSLSRSQSEYLVNRAHCFSCGRCCSYCPSDASHQANLIALRAQTAALENPARAPAAAGTSTGGAA